MHIHPSYQTRHLGKLANVKAPPLRRDGKEKRTAREREKERERERERSSSFSLSVAAAL
jgi:hypothetical protein